ncbi:hypothetical protein RND81_12G004800 [Saponaria officinalis]|uniref:Peptidase C1A papain C-terminal domain-containing protein n=1 Tax=Saponaria officinalis TaxID=3572 RepID=A0AAW1H3S8_SAPOF
MFEKHAKYIDAFNSDSSSNRTYTLALNAFSDLTDEEFFGLYTGSNTQFDSLTNASIFTYNKTVNIAPSVDWRTQGAVTPIKNQRGCGSCWAFATVAALEGIYKIKTGMLVPFSEQNLIDCVQKNHGCSGGSMANTYEYMKSTGITVEIDYPYEAKQGQCRVKRPVAIPILTIKDHKVVGPRDVNALLAAVNQQPVSVNIDSTGIRHYSSGVYDGGCSSKTNHDLTVIGYGPNYWLIKNSWGESWGEKGYMKLLRDEKSCPITTVPQIPILSF